MNRPRIKICGMTRSEDAQLAAELGAWAVGFIFYQRSSRWVQPSVAGSIAAHLPANVRKVGVFVDASLPEMIQNVEASRIDSIQLHGTESPQYCKLVKDRFPDHQVIKAIRVKEASDLATLARYDTCDSLLLDTFSPGELKGGTGKSFDWSYASMLDKKICARLIIAGGVNRENAREALHAFHPYALDVSSGVEQRPGIKDPALLRSFFSEIGGLV